ncbi:hypothetical protein ABE61_18005 [Lysinibacillus sphaericus]|uniref:DUF4280 domain-containing protein n=1 Tax=Lysinibacillus sphaericus TaxID=1421 RepID=UPI0018CFB798|nr:DUF4280 domain-containing protein [Lysinibacillus sphaericus]MBG9455894.1 hypothetical protein [Lysinibacillus sphaericus]MBG9479734.1 hypothetical protein [Lysinibacillus sphaericus]MBG9594467.1 hypothetical protein [Lysinibacillus sphaericus]
MAQVVESLETEGSEQEQFSYVVHGAIISCEFGSHLNYLNLPQDHGVYIKEKAVMNVGDRNPDNIPTFGVCLQLQKPCTPTCSIDWLEGMENVNIEGKQALLSRCHTQCSAGGGKIEIIHDGQEEVEIPKQGF